MENSNVLTRRLQSWRWTEWLRKITAAAERSKLAPINFVPEGERDDVANYDVRRILWFTRELRQGKLLDPIEIDCHWFNNQPVYPVIIDGHHRFAAAVVARKRRIAASCSGPVDMIDWLEGKTRKIPEWA